MCLPLAPLPSLKTMDLQDTGVTDLSALRTLTSLWIQLYTMALLLAADSCCAHSVCFREEALAVTSLAASERGEHLCGYCDFLSVYMKGAPHWRRP